jgi:hypothetical protein
VKETGLSMYKITKEKNIRFISKLIRPIIKQLLQKRSHRAGIATGGYLKGRLATFN